MASIDCRRFFVICLAGLSIATLGSTSESPTGRNPEKTAEPHPRFKPPQLPARVDYSEPLYGENGWVPSSSDFKPFLSPPVQIDDDDYEELVNQNGKANTTVPNAQREKAPRQPAGPVGGNRKARAVVRPFIAPTVTGADVSEGRQFFNPFRNYISPLAGVFNPTGYTNPYALNSLVVAQGQIPIVATATLSNSGGNRIGTVAFFQKNDRSNVIVMAAGTAATGAGATALTTTTAGILAIYTTPAANNNPTCTLANLGAVFNPNGVTGGGIISSTVTVSSGLLSAYVDTVPTSIITLWQPSGIIGRTVRYSLTTNNVETDVFCGLIREA